MDQPADRPIAAEAAPAGAVRRARERFLTGAAEPEPGHESVRTDIVTSWRRSLRMGLVPDSLDVPYNASAPTPRRLLDAALPVIDRLATQLTDTSATILLANSDAQIIDRWACKSFLGVLDRFNVAPGFVYAEHRVGTNGLGCALEEKRMFEVRGPEHFRACLQSLVCVAAPIVLPTTKVAQGALNVTCTVRDANGLMRPLIQQAVADIERRMLEGASLRERLLLDAFVARVRRSSHPVLAVSSDLVMANAAADQIVTASDRLLLWHWASQALQRRDTASGTIHLADLYDVSVMATKVGDGTTVPGAVLELHLPARGRSPRATRRREHSTDGIAGRSPAARRMRRAVASAATDPAPLVVTGPPGSGRTFVSRAIANADPSAPSPPVVVAEFPDDIDHLGLLPRQALIVRGLDAESTVRELADLVATAAARGVRVIATCGDIEPMSAHLRMFGHRVDVPRLRDRREDVPDLASQLLAELAGNGRRPVLRPAAMQALLRNDWPGNVRELRAVLSVALAAAGWADIAVFHLPEEYRQARTSARWSMIELAERDVILRALSEHDGNKVAAASALGLARSTLYRKIRALDIDVA